MKLKRNHIIIPFITIVVAILGGWASSKGMDWYSTQLIRPDLTPPKIAFPIAWNLIFLFTTISALIVWNKSEEGKNFLLKLFRKKQQPKFWLIMELFAANAVLNVVWSVLFFTLHAIFPAFIEMIILELTLLFLIPLVWKVSKLASLLLVPYAAWVGLATYLTYLIMGLNP